MPNRIIKESICTSDEIDQLTAFQEVFFYRLIVHCDDYGRMDARPKILSSTLFPLKDLRTAQIEDALRALTSAELVTLYTVGGKPFLQMNTWNKHQRVRDSKEKYPGIDQADNEPPRVAASCGETPQVTASRGLNPIQSESKSESKSESNPNDRRAALTAAFDTFWAAYPRHMGKKAAQKAFEKIAPDEGLLNTMLKALALWKTSQQWTKDGGQFIPHPATWLNGRRWEDELPRAGTGKQVSAQQYEQRHYQPGELDAVGGDLIAEARRERSSA